MMPLIKEATNILTVLKTTAGIWDAETCGGITSEYPSVIIAGSECNVSSTVLYNDTNGNCFRCIGYTSVEAMKVIKNTTTVYVKVDITFEEMGGSTVTDKYVYYGSTYGTLPTPTYTGKEFLGWFTASSGGTEVTAATTVTTTNITQSLYAQWSTPIPTTRLGIWQYNGTYADQLWHTKALATLGSSYNGRDARLVFVYRTATTGTTYNADIQIDRIRYGTETFEMASTENWRRDNIAAAATIGSYATRLLDADEAVGTTANTAQKWCRDPNATTSASTGRLIPNYPSGAVYALYTESSSTALGDYFWAMSPVFEFTESTTRDILMAMDGDTCGILAVYIVDDNTTDFTPSLASPSDFFPIPQTVEPLITNVSFGADFNNFPFYICSWKVQNKDTNTTSALIKSNMSTTRYLPPLTSRGTIAYNASTSTIGVTGLDASDNCYITATAQVSGETVSTRDEAYIS